MPGQRSRQRRKDGRFSNLVARGRRRPEIKEEDGGKNVGVEVDAEGKMIPAMEIAAED